MISGMYLGEVARQVLLDLIKQGVILKGNITPALAAPGSFETRFLSDIARYVIVVAFSSCDWFTRLRSQLPNE